VGREPTQGRALSMVRARSEQRAKHILQVANATKAKCEDPFNANDSRHAHRLHIFKYLKNIITEKLT
jgi:hypothetical protein